MFNKDGEIHIIASLLDFDETDKAESITLKIKAENPKSITQYVIDLEFSNLYALWKNGLSANADAATDRTSKRGFKT